ncbi:MAG: pilus assembly protein N-terminal domain-containing protein [Pseudomonadota bacterium]
MLRKILKSATLILLFFITTAFAQTEGAKEYLVVNSPRVKKLGYAIGNVTIGNPEIVNFKADRARNSITLLPKQTGTTLLLIYDERGVQRDAIELNVYPSDPEKMLQQVRQLLVDVEGVTITRMDDKIIIDGEVILPSDKDRIRKVTGNARNIVDLTRLNPDTNIIVAKKIQKEIGMDEVSVRPLKGQIILEGEVYSKQAYQKAEKIARLYSDKVMNVLETREVAQPPSRKPTIQVTAHFVEVAKNFSKNFNFRWSPIPKIGSSLSYTLNPISGSDNFTGALTGTIDDIMPKLNYFKALGVARVMENPAVSVTSEDTATIQSGTRIGFPIVQANGSVSMEFQNVGVSLTITPAVRGSDVHMVVGITVSSLGSPDITGGIAIEQNSIQTTQFVRSGESVVIGGLVRYSNRQSLDRPPSGLSSSTGASSASPVTTAGTGNFTDPFPFGSLFTLFKSTDIGKQRSQFLVFITPRILQFAKDANRELKEQFNLYEVYPEDLNRSHPSGGGPLENQGGDSN